MVSFCSEADVSGILEIEYLKYFSVIRQKTEIEGGFQLVRHPVCILQAELAHVPGWNRFCHAVVPAEYFRHLPHHHIYLLFPKGKGPGDGGKGVAGNVEGQQLPKQSRR